MGSQFVFLQRPMVAFKLHRYFTFVLCSGYCITSRACATARTNEAALLARGSHGSQKRVKREDESTAWITGYLHLLCAWHASCLCTSPYLNKRELSHYYLLHNVYWQQSSISYPYGIDVPRQSLLETNRCLVFSRVRFPVVFCHQASR